MSGTRHEYNDLFERIHGLVTARITDEITPEQFTELDALLAGNPAARRLYVQYVADSLTLPMLTDMVNASITDESSSEEKAFIDVIPTLPPVATSSRWFEGMPLAYAVSILLLGVGFLVGSFVHVTRVEPIKQEESAGQKAFRRDGLAIAKVTRMLGCRWSDPSTAAATGEAISPGRRFALKEGLLEIAFDSGTRVILQGPTAYTVESLDRGMLSVGRLTARVGKDIVVSGHDAQTDLQSAIPPETSESGRSRNGSPPPTAVARFTVATPTAVVCDLGTEFGVSVEPDGKTSTTVFAGFVRVEALGGPGDSSGDHRTLKAGETVVVSADRSLALAAASREDESRFTRTLPLLPRISRVLFEDDASRVARVFGFESGDWHGDGWRLDGDKVFFVSRAPYSQRPAVASQGACWAILASTTATRDFGQDLPIGGAITLQLSADGIAANRSRGFRLCNAAEQPRIEFFIDDRLSTFAVRDGGSAKPRDTGVSSTSRAVYVELGRTAVDSYWLRIMPLGGRREVRLDGRFLDASAGPELRRLQVWNDGSRADGDAPLFFNRIRVVAPQAREP